MTKYVFDSYAWVEYLISGASGALVNSILENPGNQVFTPVLVVAEVCSKVRKEGFDYEAGFQKMVTLSKVEQMDPLLAKDAGVFRQDNRTKIPNFGIVDAIVLLTARKLGAKVLTGDRHLKGFPETEFLK